jgi:hypothetical protein
MDPALIKNVTAFLDDFNNIFNVDKLSDYIMDIIHARNVIFITIGSACVAGLIFILIVRCFAGVIIWTSIFGVMGVLGGGGYWVFKYADKYSASDKTHNYLLYSAYAIWGIDGAFLLLVLCCCTRIRLAVAIMKVTGSFMINTP